MGRRKKKRGIAVYREESKKITFSKSIPYRHGSWVLSLISYGEPFNKIISCGSDGSLILWDRNEAKNTLTKEHTENVGSIVHSLIKWKISPNKREFEFLCCFAEGRIGCYNVNKSVKKISLKKKLLDENFQGIGIYQMMKINEDRILICRGRKISIVSYSENKILKDVYSGRFSSFTTFIPSMNFKNSFYVNLDSQHKVLLVNYQMNKTVHFEDKLLNRENISSISVYTNHRDEEIVVCGGTYNIYFFNLGYSNKNENSFPSQENNERLKEYFKIVTTSPETFKCSIVTNNNKYLIFGSDYGNISIYNTKKHVFIKKIFKVHSKQDIFTLDFLVDEKNSNIDVFSGGRDDNIVISRIKGLEFQNTIDRIKNQMKLDFLERSEFIRFNIDDFLWNKKAFLIEVKLKNNQKIQKFFKSIFLQ